ncbi:MAG: TIGR02281 family clan AA aspartic protease [Pseudomonadota bacterium]
MTADDLGRLAYIILIGVAVTGWLASDLRHRLGRTLRYLLAWCFIFLGVIGAAGLWEDIRSDLAPRQLVVENGARIEVPMGFDGHYYLTLDANGTAVDFIVDTGATDIVLTRRDAARLGIDLETLTFSGRAGTANGEVRTAPTQLDTLALGGVTDRNVPVVVNSGEMDQSLLGMRYLQRFERLEISSGTLVLER